MKFKTQTAEEIATAGLIPDKTIVPFEVVDAKEATSKKGNEMIELELRIFTPDGKSRLITTYLLESMPAQLFHFCTYAGLAAQYGSGSLRAADCLGKQGYAEIGIQKDKTGTYPPQNRIKDFVRPEPLKPGENPHPALKRGPDVPNEHMEGDPY